MTTSCPHLSLDSLIQAAGYAVPRQQLLCERIGATVTYEWALDKPRTSHIMKNEDLGKHSNIAIKVQPTGQAGIRAPAKIKRQGTHSHQDTGCGYHRKHWIELKALAKSRKHKRHRQHA